MVTGFDSPEGEGFSERDHIARWQGDIKLGQLALDDSDVIRDFDAWTQQVNTAPTAIPVYDQIAWVLSQRLTDD